MNASGTRRIRMAMAPREGFFCNDGRGWQSQWSGRGNALEWPWPTTLAGALRSAWGRAEEMRRGRAFSPDEWRDFATRVSLGVALPLRRSWMDGAPPVWSVEHRAWPTPADALAVADAGMQDLVALRPRPIEAAFGEGAGVIGVDPEPTTDALWLAVPTLSRQGKPRRQPRWWSDARFRAWLLDKAIPAEAPEHAFDLPRRLQMHVRIDPRRATAAEHFLFAHDVVETIEYARRRHSEWAIAVEAEVPGGPPEIVRLGSDGRLARAEELYEGLFAPPEELLSAFEAGVDGLRLIAVTPLAFADGWIPDGLAAAEGAFVGEVVPGAGPWVLRAAIVGRPLHVSGWDMVGRGPKATIRAVPAGSVYFFQRADGRPFTRADAECLWLRPVGRHTQDGFGRVVPGVWRLDASGESGGKGRTSA